MFKSALVIAALLVGTALACRPDWWEPTGQRERPPTAPMRASGLEGVFERGVHKRRQLNFWGFWTPSPLCHAFTQPISSVCHVLGNPPPPQCGRHVSIAPKFSLGKLRNAEWPCREMTNFHCYLMIGLTGFFIFWLLLLLRDGGKQSLAFSSIIK